MLKQSFVYLLFRKEGESLDDLMKFAKSVGYDATEVWFRDEETLPVIEAAHAAGLEVVSMCGHQGHHHGLNDPSQHDRIEAEICESLEYAVKHRIGSLIIFSGDRRPGVSEEESIEHSVAGAKRIARLAEKKNVLLNIELLNSKVDHPGYEFDHMNWGVEVCKRVGSPNVKILYDMYHAQIMEGDIIRTIKENIEHIGHFHTAGNPGRHDLNDMQEMNYKGIAAAIREIGFDHYVAHEFWTKKDPHQALAEAFGIFS